MAHLVSALRLLVEMIVLSQVLVNEGKQAQTSADFNPVVSLNAPILTAQEDPGHTESPSFL